MNKNQTFKTISVEIVNACLSAIDSSMEHFQEAKRNMQELAAFLQEDDTAQNACIHFKPQPQNNEPLCISKVNYIAILSLEQLGVSSPNQEQIDTMESVILLAMSSEKLTKEKIGLCIGEDNIARRVFLRMLKANH